jgi:hydroxymethylpyrimidine/phosphomethylpyrimidine kinase
MKKQKTLLSIAGYDPSAGAGVLLDIAVFRRLGYLGAGVLTAVTAQNSRTVADVRCLPARFIRRQYETLAREIPLSGIKVGMTGCRETGPVLGRILEECSNIPVVIDPVFRSSSGRWLLGRAAVPAFITQVRGRISVLTPNLQEAALILGRRVKNVEDMIEAAREIAGLVAAPCLVKGGHLEKRAVDVLYDGGRTHFFKREKIYLDVHGTGCCLSSSLLCFLADGRSLFRACALASAFVHKAIRRAVPVGEGRAVLHPFL